MISAIQIADGVVSLLNLAVFSQQFTAVRKANPRFTLAELAQLKVTVVPHSLELGLANRAQSELTYEVIVGIQKKLTNPENEIESMLALVMEIVEFMRGRRLDGIPAYWLKTTVNPLYAAEHLESDGVFTGNVILTYKVVQ